MVTLTVYVLYSIAAVSVRYCDSVALTVYVVSVRYGDTHCLCSVFHCCCECTIL